MVKIIIVLIMAINLELNFSAHTQEQNSKTISKNKSMHLLIYNCCLVKLIFTYVWFYIHS